MSLSNQFSLTEELNKLGEQGWEYICTVERREVEGGSIKDRTDPRVYVYIEYLFKRPLVGSVEEPITEEEMVSMFGSNWRSMSMMQRYFGRVKHLTNLEKELDSNND